MQIIEMSTTDLIPYETNPRNNDNAVEYVANSIKEFGFKVPIVIDKDNVVVCGHTRLKAAIALGINKVPCIIADDLTDQQIKAFRLADNKVSEQASWDLELLSMELDDIDFDMSDFGFEIEDDFDDEEHVYGEARERTADAYNLNEIDLKRTAGRWQIPIIKKCNHKPKDLISFNYVLNTDAFDKGVHFYIDDYQFERVWNDPQKYLERLSKFDCILTPDFSLYQEMPLAMQMWNVYRSRLLGQLWQDSGLKVIPTLQWCRPDSYEFCFDGIEPGGVVSVSTIGCKVQDVANSLWFQGMEEAEARLKPKHIICYGGDIGYKFKCPVTYISNHNADRLKGIDTGGEE